MPALSRPRATSISSSDKPFPKKLKTSHSELNGVADDPSLRACFADGVLDAQNIQRLAESYRSSEPYLHAVLDKLFKDDLLSKVKDECIGELSFTEKETDIYKVHQTGDLAALSHLAKEEVAMLPNLLKLRDALYSQTFRDFLRKVTGCGPLSGKKQDMSVNSYRKGCHLLNHDDVIDTRCVSYISYMPMPKSESWKSEWGGALELYPVKPGPDGVSEPECMPTKSIPPSWNQFIFFEVQPGRSFHSVEEVVVDEGDSQRQRLSISGWFHHAQEGEEGYEGEPIDTAKSSLAQLTSASPTYTPYPDIDLVLRTNPFAPLTSAQLFYLSSFLDPIYLQPKVIASLSKKFVDQSSIELHKFLCPPLVAKLEAGLRARDKEDGLDGETRKGRVPLHSSGIRENGPWTLRGPPHKARYCSLVSSSAAGPSTQINETEALTTVYSPTSTPEQILSVLETSLFPHPAFRSWLALIAQLLPTRYSAQARRFRPGLDYTLATSNNEQSILDVVLGLTPESEEDKMQKREREERELRKGKGREVVNGKNGTSQHRREEEEEEEEEELIGWESGEWGGWECYMAPHEGEEDPAVYRSGSSKKHSHSHSHTQNGHHHHGHNNSLPNGTTSHLVDEDSDQDSDEEDEDDDDGTLLTVQPGFNRLMLVLRDEGVMRFVKYVSAAAPGSVWDVCGEYEVYMTEEEEVDGEEGVVVQVNGSANGNGNGNGSVKVKVNGV
ncbi:NUA3_1 [Sanghuangporus weigelae]